MSILFYCRVLGIVCVVFTSTCKGLGCFFLSAWVLHFLGQLIMVTQLAGAVFYHSLNSFFAAQVSSGSFYYEIH